MQLRMLILFALLVGAVVLTILNRGGWARTLVATALFVFQVELLLVALDAAGRAVVDGVIQRGGAVKYVSEALAALKTLQWPLRIELLISTLGLYVLALACRRSRRDTPNAGPDAGGAST